MHLHNTLFATTLLCSKNFLRAFFYGEKYDLRIFKSKHRQTIIKKSRVRNKKFCAIKNIEISFWIKETISGITELKHRKLVRVLKELKKGDILICSEISRLGRNLFQIMSFLNICMQKEVQVWTIKDNYRLGTDIQSKVLAFAFSLSAEIERTLISQRTKEALSRIKSDGKKLIRQKYITDRIQF